MRLDVVDDPNDVRLRDFIGLRDPQLRATTEVEQGIFIAEGITAVDKLLSSPYPVRTVLTTPNKLDRVEAIDGIDTATIVVADRDVIAAVAGFDLHRGVVASAQRLRGATVAQLAASSRSLVVLEGLNDHENLGAIARTARALGADGLVLDPACADPLYRRCVRVSMGEILHLPIARATNWPDDLVLLHSAGFVTLAMTPTPDAHSIHDVERPAKVAVIFGAEGPGLSRPTMAAASLRVRIPVRPEVDSLNVGHAVAITLAMLTPPL